MEILRASGAKPDFVKAARILTCEGCGAHKPRAQTAKVSYEGAVGVDMLEVKDAASCPWLIKAHVFT